jgi:hypothetical protein
MLTDDSPPDGQDTLDKREAARLLDVSIRHLERLLADGELEGVPAGPRGGLLPTRRSIEQRRARTTPPPSTRSEPERAAPAMPPTSVCGPDAHDAPPSPTSPERTRVHRPCGRKLAPRASRALSHASRAWRTATRRPSRSARAILGGAIVGGLLLVGVTRDRATTSTTTESRVLVVVTRSTHDRHAARVRCRLRPGRSIHVQIRSRRRARCTTSRITP